MRVEIGPDSLASTGPPDFSGTEKRIDTEDQHKDNALQHILKLSQIIVILVIRGSDRSVSRFWR
jgi:hypothetical protein